MSVFSEKLTKYGQKLKKINLGKICRNALTDDIQYRARTEDFYTVIPGFILTQHNKVYTCNHAAKCLSPHGCG